MVKRLAGSLFLVYVISFINTDLSLHLLIIGSGIWMILLQQGLRSRGGGGQGGFTSLRQFFGKNKDLLREKSLQPPITNH